VKTVAAGNKIAVELFNISSLPAKKNFWIHGIEIVNAHILDIEVDLSGGIQPGFDEIFDEFVLGVDGDAASSGEIVEVDAMASTRKSQFDSVMDQTLSLQAVRQASFNKEIDSALFEHAGTDAFFAVLAAARFEYYGVDALKV
jgi:hypothetical protein